MNPMDGKEMRIDLSNNPMWTGEGRNEAETGFFK